MRAQGLIMNQYTGRNTTAGAAMMPMHSRYRLSAYQAAARLLVFAKTNSGTTDKSPTTSRVVCNQRGIRAL